MLFREDVCYSCFCCFCHFAWLFMVHVMNIKAPKKKNPIPFPLCPHTLLAYKLQFHTLGHTTPGLDKWKRNRGERHIWNKVKV